MTDTQANKQKDLSEVTTNLTSDKSKNTTINTPAFLIPHDFDASELMKELTKENPSFATDRVTRNAMTIIAMIKIITDHKNFTHRSLDESEYAEISNKAFKGKITSLREELTSVIKAMTKIEWIEVDSPYKVSEFSRGYRIGNRFLDSEWIEMTWEEALKIHTPALFELTQKGKAKTKGQKKVCVLSQWNRACTILNPWEHMEEGPLKEVCRHTARLLLYLSISNYDELIQLIESGAFCDSEEERRLKKQKRKRSNRRKKRRGFVSQKEDDSRPSLLRMVNAFRDQRFYISCHDQRNLNHTNRLTTNYCNLKKDFRSYLRLKDRPLIGVDIKTCQVALLATFYSDKPEDLNEKAQFVKAVTELDLYQELADRIATLSGKRFTRGEAKAKSFTLMFAKVHEEDRDIREAFRSMFPVLYRRMVVQKKAHGYTSVARKMQLKEASIMIEGVLHELLVERGIDCLSVHDSIYCHEENIETVKDSISKWFSRVMGFAPQLEVEGLEEPDLSSPISWIDTGTWSDLKDSMVV